MGGVDLRDIFVRHRFHRSRSHFTGKVGRRNHLNHSIKMRRPEQGRPRRSIPCNRANHRIRRLGAAFKWIHKPEFAIRYESSPSRYVLHRFLVGGISCPSRYRVSNFYRVLHGDSSGVNSRFGALFFGPVTGPSSTRRQIFDAAARSLSSPLAKKAFSAYQRISPITWSRSRTMLDNVKIFFARNPISARKMNVLYSLTSNPAANGLHTPSRRGGQFS